MVSLYNIHILAHINIYIHTYIYIYIHKYITIHTHIYPNHRHNTLAWCNYIASNLQDSQVEVCFCALRIPPVDLAKVHYLDGFSIYIHIYTQIYYIIF